MSKHKVEVDCTSRCKSRTHGQAITSVITKRSISDEALGSFIKGTCANFVKAFDTEGRIALHMAASRGRLQLMDWLIRHSSEAFKNARDRESGYTPLHRSIFYGQIHAAVKLIKTGVNTDILDKDDYKAIEHAMLDRQYMEKNKGDEPNEVYVWGSNSNYTLGTGTQQERNTPELLTCFNRANTCVKQVCIGKFHSVWLCGEGDVWCCGQLSRAGGPHVTALKPIPLKLAEPCVAIAITLDSTIFLMESGVVLEYSLNSTNNISQSITKAPTIIKLQSISPVMKLSKSLGLYASRLHGVVWNSRRVYTWGNNIGQLGHSDGDKIVTKPKEVTIKVNEKDDTRIKLVDACDAATVISTNRGDVYLLHKYICKKIAIKQINLRQICVEAKVSEAGIHSRVTVLLLTNVGQLFIWQDTTNKQTRCVFSLAHGTYITQMALTHDALYFTTKHGEAFIGTISRKTTPTSQSQPIKKDKENSSAPLVKFLSKEECTHVRITKIANIYRATSIAVDTEGNNFACLQIKPTCGLKSLPKLSTTSYFKQMDSLRESATPDDMLHDVIFKVGNKLYPAHMFIIASCSEYLYKLYKESIVNYGDKPVIILENIIPEAFERVMQYMYTGTCDVTELGPCGLKIRKEDLIGKKEKENNEEDSESIENPSEISAFEVYNKKGDKIKRKNRRNAEILRRNYLYCDPIKLVQATAKRLQFMTLHKHLDKFYYRYGDICLKDCAIYPQYVKSPWQRDTLPELIDTNVVSKDNIVIPAHKCVLAARLEYFQGMFLHSWTESKLLSKVTLPINYCILLPVINFLYTDSCPELENCDSIDFICNLMIVADQLFITRLREMCEVALASMITLKNCSELCQFAHTYNATQLKQFCMEFISLNLCSILENRYLELLEEELLNDIRNYYCKYNPIMSSRIITPFFNAPSDEVIEEFAKNYPVNLDLTDEDYIKEDVSVEITKKKVKPQKIKYTENQKERMRYESVSSVTSLDLSNEVSGDITLSLSKLTKDPNKGSHCKQEKWIKVPSSQQKQQKVLQARLKAVASAKDIMNETPTESFTKLTKSNSSNTMTVYENQPTSSRLSVSPKESALTEMVRSPQGNVVISHVGPKLSQKQRKKLALQGNDTISHNVENYFIKINIGSPPEQPTNPWKICNVPIASSSRKSKPVEFNKILTDQKKQREDHSRIMTKPLILTQLEDKAIEQLERFYNIHEVDDELITVRRIELHVSSPQWIHTAPK